MVCLLVMKGFSQRAGLKLLLVRRFINLSRSKQENFFSNEIRLGFHYRMFVRNTLVKKLNIDRLSTGIYNKIYVNNL